MRIIAHSGATEWGGAESGLADLLAGLTGRGHDVTLFANRSIVMDGARARGVNVRRAHLGGDLAIHDSVLFGRALRSAAPDALLIGTFQKIWLAGLAARIASVPRVVARVGMSTDTPRGPKYRFALNRWVDEVVFVAEGMRRAYVDRLPELEDRFVTIYKGLPPRGGARNPEAARRALRVPDDVPLIGSAGRLATPWRFDRLLEAMVFLPSDAHLAIAGEGPLRGALGQLSEKLGLGNRVHFLGYYPDLGPLMDALDILVITSDREGMPSAMLEAMSRGVPVVSTDVSGAQEALAPAPDGQPPGLITGIAPPEIASAMNSIVYDRKIREAMGKAAKERYAERFSFERMLDGWEAVLSGNRAACS